MRQRSKSMHAEFGPSTLQRNDDEDVSGTDDIPTGLRDLELLNMIQQFIPRNDILPFNERIEKIKWDEIKFECYTGDDLKTLFLEVLKTTRKHRLLIELVEERHKTMMPQLGIRRPANAFALFVKDHKDEIQSMSIKNHKRGSYGQIAGEMFNKADEKVKKSYQKKANKLKEEFQKAKTKYELVKPGIVVPKANERKRRGKISPVNTYIEERIASNPDVSKNELRSEYSNLPKKKKLEFILKCFRIQKGSKANLEQYLLCRACLTKEELTIFDEYENRPHLCTAYNLYVKDTIQNQNDPETPHRERFKKAAQQWNSLPSDVKQKYIEKARNDKKLFTANFSRFIASLPEDRQEYEIKMISSDTPKTLRGTKKVIAEQDTDIKDSVEARNVNNGQENIDSDDDKFEDEDSDEHETLFTCNTSVVQPSTRSGGAGVDDDGEHDMFKRGKAFNAIYTDDDDSDGSIHLFNSNKANKLESPSKSRSDKKLDKDNSPFKSPMRPAKKFHGESSQTDENETPKKTKSKKRKASETAESDSSGIQSHKKVKDKLNQDADHSQSNRAEEFKQIMALKAPEEILEYLANKSYDGSLKKAKKAFKRLSESEKEVISKEHKKAKRKFSKKFEKFKATINKSEFDRLLEDFSQ